MNHPGRIRIFLGLTAFLAGTLLFSGCSGIKTDFQERNLFRITAPFKGETVAHSTKGAGLLVRRFDIAPEFESSSFVYRVSENRFIGDYFNKFMVPPARMISDAAKEGLYATPLFKAAPPNDPGTVQYRLWGKITELYGDVRTPQAPSGVMALRLILEQKTARGFSPAVNRVYCARVPVARTDPAGLVAAWDQALNRILTDFSSDVMALPKP